MNPDVVALYKNFPLYLWVEDVLTSTYIQAVWGPQPSIGFLIAGGSPHLSALVDNAQLDGNLGARVSGLADRDFGDTNRPKWGPSTAVFRLESFEVENFLVDAQGIAAASLVNRKGANASDIEALLHAAAGDLVWWMACASTVAWINIELGGARPTAPPLSKVTCEAEAEAWLGQDLRLTTVVPALAGRLERTVVLGELHARFGDYQGLVTAGGSWQQRFAGKELLGRFLATSSSIGIVPPSRSYLDFARAVASSQQDAGRVPAELQELRAALLARI